jgi:hypothetical protein
VGEGRGEALEDFGGQKFTRHVAHPAGVKSAPSTATAASPYPGY